VNKNIIIVACITLALGVGSGYWLATQRAPVTGQQSVTKGKEKPLFYRSPMNPSVTSKIPAKDNMGMDYVPVYAADLNSKGVPGTVTIDPTVEQSIGVRTAKAVITEMSRTIQTVGRIGYDEQLLVKLHPKVSGWVEKLFINETGETVKTNTMLLSVYSPQLVASQEEYLLALTNVETLEKSPFPQIRDGARDLLRSSRERLELFDVPQHQIKEITKTRKVMKGLHIASPAAGVVLSIGAREGAHVTPATELFSIADLSRVWTYVDVYEYELPWVRLGDRVEMRVTAIPKRVFTGKVSYIYPYLDPKTRTNKLRIEFDNKDLLLKPDMFSDVTVFASHKQHAIVIPTEAVIRTGKAPKIFIKTGPGRFAPRVVKIGMEADGKTEILEGVKPGETVVTSAQFMLDSESSLQEAASKMLMPKKMTMPKGKEMDMKKGKSMNMKEMNKGKAMKNMDMSGMEMK